MVHISTTNAPETLIRGRITHRFVLYRLGLSLAASRTEVLRSATDFTGGFAPLAPPPGAPPLDPVLWFMQPYACILDVVAIFRTLKGQHCVDALTTPWVIASVYWLHTCVFLPTHSFACHCCSCCDSKIGKFNKLYLHAVK